MDDPRRILERLSRGRYLGSVAANMALVGGLSALVWQAIPPLREIPLHTLVPVNVLALLAFVGLYPVLRRLRPGLLRLLALDLAFLATFAAYGVFLAFAHPINGQMSVIEHVKGAVSLGHFFGLPVLVLCALS